MPATYDPAPEEIVDLARELIDLYHEELQDARIGLLVRDKAPKQNGRVVLGAAKRTPADMRAYIPFDFIIWFAGDEWESLDGRQQRALVDHELTHCRLKNGEWAMRGHDIEEFNAIIERYGFWRPFSEGTVLAVQRQFGFLQNAGVVAAADPAVLDRELSRQITEMFDLLDGNGEQAA